MFEKMVKKPGRYTIVVDNNLKIVSVEPINDMAGTYEVVLDNYFKIKSIKHDEDLMTEQSQLTDKKFKPEHFKHIPGGDEVEAPGELDHGCVGFGLIRKEKTRDQCRWIWGTWW